MDNKKVEKRLKELQGIYKDLPEKKAVLLKSTIETVAFMDVQIEELQKVVASGSANTPDKQLYASMAKTRDILVKKLLTELPPEEEKDDFDKF